MATNRTFGNMLNQKGVSKKVMSEDDMAKPFKPKVSSYAGMVKKEKK